MSWQSCPDPVPGDPGACDLIDTIVVPRMRDLGGFEVGRVLPAPQQGMVGPFIFLIIWGRPSSLCTKAWTCGRIRISI